MSYQWGVLIFFLEFFFGGQCFSSTPCCLINILLTWLLNSWKAGSVSCNCLLWPKQYYLEGFLAILRVVL